MPTTMPKPIIIIEDDPDLREELEVALRLEGFEVHCAANGREGLYALTSLGDSPVVLLDLMMPVLSGWDVIDWLQRIGSHAKIIAISAVAGAEHPAGAAAFLRKPLKLDDLLPIVHELAA